MMHNRFRRAVAIALPVFYVLLPLTGCESAARTASPTVEPSRQAAESAPTTAPSPPAALAVTPESPAAVEPAPTEPIEPPKPVPAEEQLPPYVKVVERFNPGDPAEIHVDLNSPQLLVINTRNVRRLWIDREHAPLAMNSSVVLRLDDQGIEWTASSRTREFERTINGAWGAARHEKR